MSLEVLLANSAWLQALTPEEQSKVKSDLFVKKTQSESYICRRGVHEHPRFAKLSIVFGI